MDGSYPPPAEPPPSGPPDTEWHRPMLRELARMAMDATCLAHIEILKQNEAPETPPSQRAATNLAFTRLSREVRQSIALDARLAHAQHEAATGAADERARRARTESRRHEHRRATLRRRLIETIRDTTTPCDTDALLADIDDRLDDADIQAALATRSPTSIVSDLCDEWGITPNFSHWTDEELERSINEPRPP